MRFRVIVKVDKTEEKEPTVVAEKVGKTLRVSVKSGKIGSLKVKPVFQLRGLCDKYMTKNRPKVFTWRLRPPYWFRVLQEGALDT